MRSRPPTNPSLAALLVAHLKAFQACMVVRRGLLGGVGEGKVAGRQKANTKRLRPVQGALLGSPGGTGREPGPRQGHNHESREESRTPGRHCPRQNRALDGSEGSKRVLQRPDIARRESAVRSATRIVPPARVDVSRKLACLAVRMLIGLHGLMQTWVIERRHRMQQSWQLSARRPAAAVSVSHLRRRPRRSPIHPRRRRCRRRHCRPSRRPPAHRPAAQTSRRRRPRDPSPTAPRPRRRCCCPGRCRHRNPPHRSAQRPLRRFRPPPPLLPRRLSGLGLQATKQDGPQRPPGAVNTGARAGQQQRDPGRAHLGKAPPAAR